MTELKYEQKNIEITFMLNGIVIRDEEAYFMLSCYENLIINDGRGNFTKYKKVLE